MYNELTRLEDDFVGHQINERTVVIENYARKRDERRIRRIIRKQGLRCISSGWSKHGYAVEFENYKQMLAFWIAMPQSTVPRACIQ